MALQQLFAAAGKSSCLKHLNLGLNLMDREHENERLSTERSTGSVLLMCPGLEH